MEKNGNWSGETWTINAVSNHRFVPMCLRVCVSAVVNRTFYTTTVIGNVFTRWWLLYRDETIHFFDGN